MKFEQVAPLLNSVLKETLGETAVQVEDLQNVVELGKAYEDIIIIAEIIENWREKGSDSGYICDSFFNIIDILDKGDWI